MSDEVSWQVDHRPDHPIGRIGWRWAARGQWLLLPILFTVASGARPEPPFPRLEVLRRNPAEPCTSAPW